MTRSSAAQRHSHQKNHGAKNSGSASPSARALMAWRTGWRGWLTTRPRSSTCCQNARDSSCATLRICGHAPKICIEKNSRSPKRSHRRGRLRCPTICHACTSTSTCCSNAHPSRCCSPSRRLASATQATEHSTWWPEGGARPLRAMSNWPNDCASICSSTTEWYSPAIRSNRRHGFAAICRHSPCRACCTRAHPSRQTSPTQRPKHHSTLAQYTSLRLPRAPLASTTNFGTMNSEMPFTPSGASGVRASTRCTMLSARSCSP